ncbi:hypothetical protein EV127DRAFT_496637 [Xylaria flabelliformis]|nr:hypothetical protein EV127DRAFT_496637 [Xylaria flabelliformis]
MLDYIENITQAPEASNGRSRGKRILKDGRSIKGLLEWTPATPEVFLHYLEAIEERIPTSGGRAEEVHTMKINGLFRQGSRTAIFYECEESPIDLREVLLKVPRPPDYVIRALAKPVDYTRPYLLDMARSPIPEIYRHPEYRPDGELAWFYQVWALMMILSEIAEWKPLDQVKPGEESGVELLRRKLSRRRQVTSAEWQSGLPTQVFRLGFGFLDADRETLETYNRWRVKRFYDELCELLSPDQP